MYALSCMGEKGTVIFVKVYTVSVFIPSIIPKCVVKVFFEVNGEGEEKIFKQNLNCCNHVHMLHNANCAVIAYMCWTN